MNFSIFPDCNLCWEKINQLLIKLSKNNCSLEVVEDEEPGDHILDRSGNSTDTEHAGDTLVHSDEEEEAKTTKVRNILST